MPRPETLPVGKLNPRLLNQLLERYVRPDPRVIVGPGLGEDAAVVDFGASYLVLKSDPITFATQHIGWYLLHVNANDLACMGALPRWLLVTLLLPEGRTTAESAEAILRDVAEACQTLNVALIGGHTEVTHGLERPLVVGTLAGEVAPDRLVRPDGLRPGDRILLTKGLAVEGTALICLEKADRLGGVLSHEELERCRGFLYDPGISVLPEAQAAVRAGTVHAMHDPTEGGLAAGVHEMARASGVAIRLLEEGIPIFPETRRLCRHFGLDPLRLIASGSLLLGVPRQDKLAIQQAIQASGSPAEEIGWVEEGQGIMIRRAEAWRELAWPEQDEIARLFS